MRVRRNLLTLAAALSAILCVAVCAAWVSSYLGEADTLELSSPAALGRVMWMLAARARWV